MYSVGEGSGGHYANWLLKCSQHLSSFDYVAGTQQQKISLINTLPKRLTHCSKNR